VVTGLLLAATAVFVALARAGWPGTPSRCLRDFVCYCERPTLEGLARQPWNAWSSLACAPFAVQVAADAAGVRTDRSLDEPRRRAGAEVGLLFAIAIAIEGMGSLYFHGSLTNWGAVLDAVGIAAIGGVVLLAALLRGGVVGIRGVRWGLPAVVAGALVYRLFLVPVMAPLFLVLVLAIVLAERRAQRAEAGRRAEAPRSRGADRWPARGPWFARGMWLFGIGAAVLVLSALPGFPLCGGGLVQGHALWHLLAAGASWACWRHARWALVPEHGS